MPAPATADELVDLVRRSGLLEDGRLDAYLASLRAAGKIPNDPAKLADRLVRDGLMTRFQVEQLLQGKCRGLVLGKYKVLERIGAGGMALVYLCEHQTMRRRVAVKVLPSSFAQDEEYLERFQREARAAISLKHPNIVRAYDIDRHDKTHFLVMEYVEGILLHDLVRKEGPLAIERACDCIRQAALGLQHAHEAGLVHRDIKPGNLILDRKGTVKVLDLGLARSAQETGEVLTQGLLGTPDYLAPEQGRDSHDVDIRADIYALGCTFYYLLAGRPPFAEGTPTQKIVWHQTQPPPPVGLFRPEVPDELEAVLDRMMAKDPKQRYQIPAEVAAALAPWTAGAAPSAPGRPTSVSSAHAPKTDPRLALKTDPDLGLTPFTPPAPRAAARGIQPPRRPIAPPPSLPRQPATTEPAASPALPSAADRPPPKARWRWLLVVIALLALAAGVGLACVLLARA
jgi:serine/threonine protein kinase